MEKFLMFSFISDGVLSPNWLVQLNQLILSDSYTSPPSNCFFLIKGFLIKSISPTVLHMCCHKEH